jgi:hypothetical protein
MRAPPVGVRGTFEPGRGLNIRFKKKFSKVKESIAHPCVKQCPSLTRLVCEVRDLHLASHLTRQN